MGFHSVVTEIERRMWRNGELSVAARVDMVEDIRRINRAAKLQVISSNLNLLLLCTMTTNIHLTGESFR